MRSNESSIKLSLTDGEAIFDIFEKQPWGRPDIRRTVTLALDRDPDLPLLPGHVENFLGYEDVERFWIPPWERWVGFILTAIREKADGPWDEEYYGPYLFPGPPHPEQESDRSTMWTNAVTAWPVTDIE